MTEDIFASEITYNTGNLPAYYMSKREYFAAKAMHGMLANGCSIDIDKEYPFATRAKTCILIADALIKALNESQP